MLYAAVRPIAKLGLRHYLGRIDLAHADRIPKDKPVIIAANHPTTFIEPCILACFLDEPLNFLARGDLFQSAIAASLLRGVHIIPIYRFRDAGTEGVKKNYQSFQECYNAFTKNKTVMILAEGRCIHEKRLRPIQKGTARIAIGALENEAAEEIYIVPVGVNFTYADRFRSDVMLNCGEPILASEFLASYQDMPTRAINELTDTLRQRLAQDVVIIERQEDEILLEVILQIYRSEHPRFEDPKFTTSDTQLRAEKRIADAINGLSEQDRFPLRALCTDYLGRLHQMRITDAALRGNLKKERQKTSRVLLGLIPALLLLIWHLPPLLLAQWIGGTKIKTIEFASPVRWGSILGLYLLYFLIWITIPIATGHYWWLITPLAGFLSVGPLIAYVETAQRWLLAWRVARQTPHEINYARQQRKQILEQVKAFWT